METYTISLLCTKTVMYNDVWADNYQADAQIGAYLDGELARGSLGQVGPNCLALQLGLRMVLD